MKRPVINKIVADISSASIYIRTTRKYGKALACSEPVVTIAGMEPIGNIKEGTLVYSDDGKAYPVTGIYDQGVKDVFKVTFDDGSYSRCTDEHLWTLIDNATGQEETLPLNEVMNRYKELDRDGCKYKYHLPMIDPILYQNIGVDSAGSVRRNLVSIEPDGREECRCIQIDSPSHLYLTRDFIPTHNTTLFRDTVLEKYKDPSYGLLVKCGVERGDTMLDQVNSIECRTWKDFLDLKHWLIHKEWIERDDSGKEIARVPLDHHIKLIVFDVVGEMFSIAEKEVVRLYNRENPTKKVRSINAVYGGFNKGVFACADEVVKPYLDDLICAGFHPWYFAHTANKPTNTKGTTEEEGWMQLTSNLNNTYENLIGGNLSDIVLTGTIERSGTEEEVSSFGRTVKKKHATKEERKLYFRANLGIDTGGRFKDGSVPEYMIFDKPNMGADFIQVIETGMELSKLENADRLKKEGYFESDSSDDLDSLDENETSELSTKEEEIEDLFDEVDVEEDELEEEVKKEYPEDLITKVAALHRKCKDKKLRAEIMEMVAPYERLSKAPREKLEEFYDLLTQ
ncbi:hypothetical protein [Ileibacterium valens]|uniref:hypothetical protein n=1 Tax=Ileibacterium valens TaxID=1862668 RepID=UPI002730DFB8|nr:hypothetical protein [Ileibacterium valens]